MKKTEQSKPAEKATGIDYLSAYKALARAYIRIKAEEGRAKAKRGSK